MSNKVKVSNPQNKVFEDYTKKVSSIIERKASEMYRDKTFGEEYKSIFFASESLKLVCSILSSITVFVALNWALSPLIGFISPLISFAICVLLEILKTSVWNKLAKHRLKYKETIFLLGIGALGLNILSGSGSVFGAWQLPNMVDKMQTKEAVLIDIDSTRNSYTSRLEALSTQIVGLQSEVGKTTSNSTKRAITGNITILASQKNTLFDVQQNAIEAATEENKTRSDKANDSNRLEGINRTKELESMQLNCVLFALTFELILIVCFMFGAYYLHRVEVDRTGGTVTGETETESVTETETELVISSPIATAMPVVAKTLNVAKTPHKAPKITTKRNKIGFGTPNVIRCSHESSTTPPVHKTPNDLTQTDYDNTKRVGVCAFVGCQQPFEFKNDSKQYCNGTCRGRAFRQRTKESTN